LAKQLCGLRNFDNYGAASRGGFRFSDDKRCAALDTFSGIFFSTFGNCQDYSADISGIFPDEKRKDRRRIKRNGFALCSGFNSFERAYYCRT
jgi:hypothetical protein